MEHYKILGVDKNASMEEVKKAYEDKCRKFKEEIKDERRARAFLKVFDKAYEKIRAERMKLQNQETILINGNLTSEKIRTVKDVKEDKIDERKAFNKNNYSSNKKNKNKIKQKKNKDKKLQKIKKNKYKESTSKVKSNKRVNKKRKSTSTIDKIIRVILKIIAFPIVLILSILILLCKIISLISWLASKAMIIGAIALSAIHGYQIYQGQAIDYNIFIVSSLAFIIGLFLPNIIKVLPIPLEKIKNVVKKI